MPHTSRQLPKSWCLAQGQTDRNLLFQDMNSPVVQCHVSEGEWHRGLEQAATGPSVTRPGIAEDTEARGH